jgi:NAD dependent epimerase/dehydratase family enzyme
LRLALGEVADVLFSSQRAVPKAALDASFQFRHPELEPALKSILAAP